MEEKWALWVILVLIVSSFDGLALRTTSGEALATNLRLMTRTEEGEILPRRGPAIRENEIAAIFRGVAYGAPTPGGPNVTSPLPSATETTKTVPLPPSSVGKSPGSHHNSDVLTMKERHYSQDRRTKQTNQSSVVDKDVEIFSRKNTSSARNDKRHQYASDFVEITTYFPVATRHTSFENINSNSKINRSENANSSRGVVWISSFPRPLNIHWNLGIAWWVHVYVSVGLFTVLALVSLCLMARVAITTRLLPRPHYLALHILIFCASFVRSLQILHESYDMKYLLPVTLLIVVEEFGWPCLTAALAVLLVSVLKEWRYPSHPHLALLLYLFTTMHFIAMPTAHFSIMWLKQENIPAKVITGVISTGWGGVLGIGGMWAVWRESRDYSPHLTDIQINNNLGNLPAVTHPARLVLTAALTQLLLASLHLYMLLVPVSPESHTWIWWSCVTISRGLELIVGSTLLTAAALTLARQNPCNIFVSCCQKRTVEIVHPAEIKMIHPMGVYTLQPARPKNEHAQTIAALSLSNSHKDKRDRSSLDYVTSDFQLVWNNSRQRMTGTSQTNQHIVSDMFQVCADVPSAHIIPRKPIKPMESFLGNKAISSTLPRNRMYAAPNSCYPLQNELKSSVDGSMNYASKTSTLLSGSSGSSKLYSSPQIPLRSSRSWDEISTGHIYEDLTKAKSGSIEEALSDLSDMNIDYMNEFTFGAAVSPVLARPTWQHQNNNHSINFMKLSFFEDPKSQPSPGINVSKDSSCGQQNPIQQIPARKITPQPYSKRQDSNHYFAGHQNTAQINHQVSSQKPLADHCMDISPSDKSHITDMLSSRHSPSSPTQEVPIHVTSSYR